MIDYLGAWADRFVSLHTGRYGIQDLDLHGGATLQI